MREMSARSPARPAGSVLPVVAGLGVLMLVLACSPRPRLARNVILISIDTLRSDHLGCYGYARDTSPNLDALCREAAVFEQAISQAPSTLPSHASMLTSLLPSQHGASYARRQPLSDQAVTLAEVLEDHGFHTAAFTDGGQIAYRWNLHQGFEVYETNHTKRVAFDRVVTEGLRWLDETRDEAPFFLFLHTYEVHRPYTPSAKDLRSIGAAPYDGPLGGVVKIRELERINRGLLAIDDEDRSFIQAAYDAEIRSMDRALGFLLQALRERRLGKRTLIVFTSDHGEEFGEHGRMGWHSDRLFDEAIRVPLVFRVPGEQFSGKTIRRQVRLIDLAPTVLDILGLESPAPWQGVSLLPLVRGEEVDPLLAISQVEKEPDPPIEALRTGRWKLYAGKLYDLQLDPAERFDASTGRTDLVRALKFRLSELTAGGELAAEPIELDPETRERLEALGYL